MEKPANSLTAIGSICCVSPSVKIVTKKWDFILLKIAKEDAVSHTGRLEMPTGSLETLRRAFWLTKSGSLSGKRKSGNSLVLNVLLLDRQEWHPLEFYFVWILTVMERASSGRFSHEQRCFLCASNLDTPQGTAQASHYSFYL